MLGGKRFTYKKTEKKKAESNKGSEGGASMARGHTIEVGCTSLVVVLALVIGLACAGWPIALLQGMVGYTYDWEGLDTVCYPVGEMCEVAGEDAENIE
tara:strand:+ start:653 stop:946 length:294 start_codon:yes stop_codon:yes gene_type:complete